SQVTRTVASPSRQGPSADVSAPSGPGWEKKFLCSAPTPVKTSRIAPPEATSAPPVVTTASGRGSAGASCAGGSSTRGGAEAGGGRGAATAFGGASSREASRATALGGASSRVTEGSGAPPQ